MSFLKKILSLFTDTSEKSENTPSNNEIEKELLSPKVRDFLDGKTNTLSAKDAYPDLKVFQPVKTRKNASIEEITYRLKNAIKYLHLPAAYKDILICLRMIIRVKKKEGKDFHSDLTSLYSYACQYNFLIQNLTWKMPKNQHLTLKK